ncbi:MAG: DUF3617 domain-containing protein [Lautropia sp.]
MSKDVLARYGSVVLVSVVVGGLAAIPAQAQEFPKRRPGLWEMKSSGGPMGSQTMQQCIDAATDDLLRGQSDARQKCSKPVIRRDGDRYQVAMTCDREGVQSSFEGQYTMRGDIAYQGDMKMRFTPAMAGVSEMNIKVDGRWIGACKPGMKPGDVAMPGVPGARGGVNLLERGRGGSQMTPEQARREAEKMLQDLGRKPSQ